MNNKVFAICLTSLTLFTSALQAQGSLKTPWAEKIDRNNVLGEYPRPMLVRADWQNLNGTWEFQEAQETDPVPFGKSLSGKILVPFAWESALSGVQKQFDSNRAWYRRTFDVPTKWQGQKILLHFGAVDWQATVYVNGRSAGTHQGGYDAFSFDITPFLNLKGLNELIVAVFDPTNDAAIAYGKQNRSRFADPQRYAYSPVSGIWQTVWLEPVPRTYVSDFHLMPDIDAGKITVLVNATGNTNRLGVEVVALDGPQEVSKISGDFDVPFELNIPQPKLWSPNSPFLYDIVIRIKDSLRIVDEVKGYFGMRKISLKQEKGTQRLALNNNFLFQFGPLDQGYWPDGLYTAPTDEALKWDIEQAKGWGFNMIRKHIKVEPQRWYYWCDKLGILVWQDMPSTFKKRSEEDKIQFESELQRMVNQHWNHPSIVNWVVFNEHWGIYDVERITNSIMALDPSRLVTGNSGIDAGRPNLDYEVGHIKDNHSYRPPSLPLVSNRRATVNGEFGAIGYNVEGHIWDADGPWVHFNYEGKEEATAEYERFVGMITDKFLQGGLSGAVYTQWTDVENEMNGLYTYDRKVIKLDKDRVKRANISTWTVDKLMGKAVKGVNE